jgi:hypothetical protein
MLLSNTDACLMVCLCFCWCMLLTRTLAHSAVRCEDREAVRGCEIHRFPPLPCAANRLFVKTGSGHMQSKAQNDEGVCAAENSKVNQLPQHLLSAAEGCRYLYLWLDCDREGENICFEVISILRSGKTHTHTALSRAAAAAPTPGHARISDPIYWQRLYS